MSGDQLWYGWMDDHLHYAVFAIPFHSIPIPILGPAVLAIYIYYFVWVRGGMMIVFSLFKVPPVLGSTIHPLLGQACCF